MESAGAGPGQDPMAVCPQWGATVAVLYLLPPDPVPSVVVHVLQGHYPAPSHHRQASISARAGTVE